MNKNQQPDRASDGDFDDLSDVPTYRPNSSGSLADKSGADTSSNSGSAYDVYQKSGRTAPQRIEPTGTGSAAGSTAGSAAGASPVDASSVDRSGSLKSDAPTSSFDRAPRDAGYRNSGANETVALDRNYSSSQEPQRTEVLSTADTSANTAQYRAVSQPEPAATYSDSAYVAPATTPVVADTDYAATETRYENEHDAVDHRRGTMDFGLAIIRVAMGLLLILQSMRTFFQLGGHPGLNGLKEEFANYAYPDILSIAIPSIELAAGVFLLLGLLTPVAAALAIVATTFNFLHEIAKGDGFNILNMSDGTTLALLMTILAIGLMFTGPGRVSLDVSRSWARRPLASSWILAILGIAGAVALWWFGAAVNPFA